ncbi:MAG: SulP family inorganic anion transporter [Acidimicrobiia bacterium]|nr:SulP family inorganic anion transporter [Acidimicrobiia bacterium]
MRTTRKVSADLIPGIRMLRDYERSFFRYDLVAGLVLATMLIPQGMAYAELTGLPAITGIYTTIAALLAYSLLGPNRQLILGPDSSLAPIIAAVILPLAAGDTASAVVLASALSVITGVVCILAGYLRAGIITELLSKPIRIGYLNGIAVVVLISQLPKALGFSVDEERTVDVLIATIGEVLDGETVLAALALSAGTVLIVVGLRRVSPTIPGIVVAALLSIATVSLFDLVERGVRIVGDIPAGLPPLTIPEFSLDDFPTLLGGAVAVALVSFADTGALSTATALKSGVRVDPNSEIKALGAANILSGVFQGFPTSASSSRTAVAMAVGSKTQLTGLIAAVGVITVMLAAPGLVAEMPSPTLAAIVITASFSLFDWPETKWLFKARRSEFVMLLGSFLGVVVVGILEGIAIAVVLSLANFIRKALRPHSTELGKIKGVPGYHDRDRHPEATVVPGLLIVRFDAPLFFANAPRFGRRLQEMMRSAERPIDTILVVGNAITDIDTTGAEILGDVLDNLDAMGVTFAFAGLKGHVKDHLRSYGIYDRIGDEHFHPNTISAVKQYVKEHPTATED